MIERTEELEEFTPYLINRIIARYNKGVESALKAVGVSVAQMRALAVLAEGEPCTINELSVLTVIKQSTLSRTLDNMEQAGLILREARGARRRQPLSPDQPDPCWQGGVQGRVARDAVNAGNHAECARHQGAPDPEQAAGAGLLRHPPPRLLRRTHA